MYKSQKNLQRLTSALEDSLFEAKDCDESFISAQLVPEYYIKSHIQGTFPTLINSTNSSFHQSFRELSIDSEREVANETIN